MAHELSSTDGLTSVCYFITAVYFIKSALISHYVCPTRTVGFATSDQGDTPTVEPKCLLCFETQFLT